MLISIVEDMKIPMGGQMMTFWMFLGSVDLGVPSFPDISIHVL